MEGLIKIHKYRVQCTIGVEEREKNLIQEILVDLTVQVDLADALESDTLEESVDYVALGKVIESVAKEEHFQLIETYAHTLLSALFAQFPLLWAKVCVYKKGALPLAESVSVELECEA